MNTNKRLFCVLLVIILMFSFNVSLNTFASVETKEQLEQRLNEIDKELSKLSTENAENKVDRDNLNKKLNLLETQCQTNETLIQQEQNESLYLKNEIKKSNFEIAQITKDISEKENLIEKLNSEYQKTFKLYTDRLRAIYISGGFVNYYTLLLNTNGIQDYLTKTQMVSSVTRKDAKLLADFKKKSNKILKEKEKLQEKQISLNESIKENQKKQKELSANEEKIQKDQEKLKQQKENLSKNKASIENEIKEIDKKTKEFGELREETAAELAEIDDEIAQADKKYPVEKPTREETTTKIVTTTEPSTTENEKQKEVSTTHATTTTTTTTKPTTQISSGYISLTYPCPSYKTITCGFGEYSGHTGCDFSTRGNENLKIVAAESGTVIVSRDLTNPDGSYRSYGRYIVIRHDKLTASGKTVYTLYAHNNSRIVYEGQHVSKGQTIAYSGSTGNSSGPHCHFEVRIGGSSQSYAVNPAYYLH